MLRHIPIQDPGTDFWISKSPDGNTGNWCLSLWHSFCLSGQCLQPYSKHIGNRLRQNDTWVLDFYVIASVWGWNWNYAGVIRLVVSNTLKVRFFAWCSIRHFCISIITISELLMKSRASWRAKLPSPKHRVDTHPLFLLTGNTFKFFDIDFFLIICSWWIQIWESTNGNWLG